jgi:acetyl-CoA C-acetyltransferase
MRSVLADFADSVFVSAFEVQNTMKAVYGADVLAGAAYYNKERKKGGAFFFPELFSDRAGAYFEKYFMPVKILRHKSFIIKLRT